MAKTCNVYVSVSRTANGKMDYSNYCLPLATALTHPKYIPDTKVTGSEYIVTIDKVDTLNKTAVIRVSSANGAYQPPISTIDKRNEVKVYKNPTSSSQFYSAILPNGTQLHVGIAEFDIEKPEEFFAILDERHAIKFDPKTTKASNNTHHNVDDSTNDLSTN